MSVSIENPLAPWGAITPQNWQVRRLGSVADVIFSNVDKHTLQGELPVRLCNYSDVYKNDRITSDLEFMQATALPREMERFQVQKGDVLATKDSESPNDIAISALIAEELPGVLCGYHLAIIRPEKKLLCGNFLAWVQSSKRIRAQYEAQAVGVTRFALGQSAFKETSIPLPPLAEQRRIAAYLDEQTGKIDRLMALRRRQMELLREQRAALIQEVVTRGLDRNVRFRNSRIPWLGEIPEHWEVKRVKFLFREIDHRSTTGDEELLTVSHISGVTPRSEKNDVTMFLAESHEGYKIVEEGDLAINTMWAWMGALGFSRYHGIVSPSYNVYRPRQEIVIEYYDCLFRSPVFVKEITRHSTGIWESRLRLYPQAFFEIRCPVPPIEEQRQIMGFVESQTGRMEDAITVLSRQIALLQQYRAALIHECVTGQRPVPDNPSITL